MTYEMLMRHAADMRDLAVSVASAGIGDDPYRRRSIEREFADLPDAFRPIAGFPDPRVFEARIERVRDVLRGLSTGDGELAAPGIGDLSSSLRNWQGEAAERFKAGFVEPWPAFVRNQCTVGVVLKAGLEAQRDIWARARQDADQIAEQGLAAVGACGDCTRTEWTVTFTVVASVAAIVAVPVGVGLALAAGGIAGLAQVAAATGPAEAPRTTFSADDPAEVADRVREAVTQLRRHVHEKQDEVHRALRDTGRVLTDQPGLFGWR
ncbi:hypothetical protein ABT369_56415 [Dactylosporangium sp. NPDC000244]|uniref:hypothetical protein n=1 Tax=Dactylosporangium sp. NPDC000244 TaxID=3154365 RepID=UPI00332A029E